MGRFTSPDPGPFVLYEPQSFNLYEYALNSPMRYGDDDGLTAQDRVNAANALASQNVAYARGGGHPGNASEGCGLDCSGLLYKVLKADPDNSIDIHGSFTAASEAALFKSKGQYSTNIDTAQPGDAIFWSESGNVVHTGVVVDVRDGKVYFVHAPRPGRNVNRFYVKLISPDLGNEKFVGVGRPIEAEPTRGVATTTSGNSLVGTWQSLLRWLNPGVSYRARHLHPNRIPSLE